MSGLADVDHVPGRAFDEYILRRVADFGVRPAHDAGDGKRTNRIADQHSGFVQLAFDTVQGGELLTLFGCAGADLHRFAGPSFDQQGVVIESMQRLADLEHDVVGGVNNVIDGAHPGHLEAAADEFG